MIETTQYIFYCISIGCQWTKWYSIKCDRYCNNNEISTLNDPDKNGNTSCTKSNSDKTKICSGIINFLRLI